MSVNQYQVIPDLLNLVQGENPISILDIGTCIGKYGLLIREMLEYPFQREHKERWKIKLDGMEIFSDYKNPVHEYVYNNINKNNLLENLCDLPIYDIILLDNVLNYYTKEEGIFIIRQLLKHSRKCILAILSYESKTSDRLNVGEKYKSSWSAVDLIDFDTYFKSIPIGSSVRDEKIIYKIYPNSEKMKYPAIDQVLSIRDANITSRGTNDQLKIGYILPHKNLTGGMKMLLEQMRNLRRRGHQIYAFYRGEPEETFLPAWSDIEVDREILVPQECSYVDYIQDCDVVVAGWFMQLPDLINKKVPVLYWEQGHEWLFGETGDLMKSTAFRRYLQQCYSQPCAIAAVSPIVSKLLFIRYGRKAPVLTNGMDIDLYCPEMPKKGYPDMAMATILLVGNPGQRFKGFETALQVLRNVWRVGYRFKVQWICQVQPQVNEIEFPIQFIVKPVQKELARYYRNADIFLFTSWYEGFGMPPLEAMASGVPVVATRCGGVETYAKHGYNAFLADPGDINELAKGIAFLLENKDIRALLSQKGRETALQYQFDQVIQNLENYLKQLVSYFRKITNSED